MTTNQLIIAILQYVVNNIIGFTTQKDVVWRRNTVCMILSNVLLTVTAGRRIQDVGSINSVSIEKMTEDSLDIFLLSEGKIFT